MLLNLQPNSHSQFDGLSYLINSTLDDYLSRVVESVGVGLETYAQFGWHTSRLSPLYIESGDERCSLGFSRILLQHLFFKLSLALFLCHEGLANFVLPLTAFFTHFLFRHHIFHNFATSLRRCFSRIPELVIVTLPSPPFSLLLGTYVRISRAFLLCSIVAYSCVAI